MTRRQIALEPRRFWTAADDAVLRRLYPHQPTITIAQQLRRSLPATYVRARTLGLAKSAEYMKSPAACRLRRGDNVGAGYRFPKGHVPANKGLRRPGYGPGRMKDTQFKPGVRQGIAAKNWCPVGTIKTDHEGYQRIKVREASPGEAYGFGNARVWPLLHRHIWTQAYGPIPSGRVVAFRDGHKQHCSLDNLELVSRRDLMRRNTVHNLPKPLANAIQLLGALKRQIRRRTRHAAEQDQRPS